MDIITINISDNILNSIEQDNSESENFSSENKEKSYNDKKICNICGKSVVNIKRHQKSRSCKKNDDNKTKINSNLLLLNNNKKQLKELFLHIQNEDLQHNIIKLYNDIITEYDTINNNYKNLKNILKKLSDI